MIKKAIILFVGIILCGTGCVDPPQQTPSNTTNTGIIRVNPIKIPNQPDKSFNSEPSFDAPAPKPAVQPDDTKIFQNGNESYFGTATVTGYMIIESVLDCGEDCNTQTAPKIDLARFQITSSSNKIFDQFLKQRGTNGIILGCLSTGKNEIRSYNEGDFSTVNNVISGQDYEDLINSSVTNSIHLQFAKPYYTGGHGTSRCYSDFRNFKVIRK